LLLACHGLAHVAQSQIPDLRNSVLRAAVRGDGRRRHAAGFPHAHRRNAGDRTSDDAAEHGRRSRPGAGLCDDGASQRRAGAAARTGPRADGVGLDEGGPTESRAAESRLAQAGLRRDRDARRTPDG